MRFIMFARHLRAVQPAVQPRTPPPRSQVARGRRRRCVHPDDETRRKAKRVI
jgi:hypothetical protein